MAKVNVEGDELVFRTKLVNVDDYVVRLIQECDLIEPTGERQNQETREEVPYEKGICGDFYPDWSQRDSQGSKISCRLVLGHQGSHRSGNPQPLKDTDLSTFIWGETENKVNRCAALYYAEPHDMYVQCQKLLDQEHGDKHAGGLWHNQYKQPSYHGYSWE